MLINFLHSFPSRHHPMIAWAHRHRAGALGSTERVPNTHHGSAPQTACSSGQEAYLAASAAAAAVARMGDRTGPRRQWVLATTAAFKSLHFAHLNPEKQQLIRRPEMKDSGRQLRLVAVEIDSYDQMAGCCLRWEVLGTDCQDWRRCSERSLAKRSVE